MRWVSVFDSDSIHAQQNRKLVRRLKADSIRLADAHNLQHR